MRRVGIVGAGMTGLTAAAELQKEGIEVFLLDKGKSVGGRMATRRVGDGKADHGAQFFTVRSDEFQQDVNKWIGDRKVKKWFGDHHPRYQSPNGMNALAKYLAENLRVYVNRKVQAIDFQNGRYQLYTEENEIFEATDIILTPPSPQVIEMLNNSRLQVDQSILKTLKFSPCLVAIAELYTEMLYGDHGQIMNPSSTIQRIINHEQKGISKTPVLSIYMNKDWSEKHFDEHERELLQAIKNEIKEWTSANHIKSIQIKKWRYAEVEQVLHQPFAKIMPSLLVAGDAFLRREDETNHSRLESAYLSGKSAAAELMGKNT
ncbi:NAD(P)/FAD-dependent oxidoreductase [Priestia megaterium]|uniref:NAD(P)/FAD-dependent oxidoreductase n=1 Tax=Priestia megaterium TaxID=1404 RepID=UPI000762710C|nr:FAD-dependent oxidoreductase [Priestia megaterium]KWU53996.1 NAD/FAD-dependent oxidoreductase [Priestia megaterium]